MPDDAVTLIRAAFEEAVERGGGGDELDALSPAALEAVFSRFDPAVEFHEDPTFPEPGVYRGIEEVRRYLTGFAETFDEARFRAEDFIDLGDGRVLVLLTLTTRGRDSSVSVESRPGWLYELREGRVTKIEAWLDRETALRKAGIER